MDSDGELRLTIMATLAQEESRKKPLISQRNQRLDLRCVQLKMGKKERSHNPKGLCDRIYISCFAYATASTSYWRCSRMAACVVTTKSRNKQASSITTLRLQSKLFNGQSVNKTGGMIYSSPWYLESFL